ncbi:MAG: hypothetical protein ACOCQR_00965 [bacterium]
MKELELRCPKCGNLYNSPDWDYYNVNAKGAEKDTIPIVEAVTAQKKKDDLLFYCPSEEGHSVTLKDLVAERYIDHYKDLDLKVAEELNRFSSELIGCVRHGGHCDRDELVERVTEIIDDVWYG